jgi:hypothetical protein
VDYSRDLVLLGWWPLFFSLEWWARIPGMECMVSHPFATIGNRSYLEFWAVTSDPQYPRYFITTGPIRFCQVSENLLV